MGHHCNELVRLGIRICSRFSEIREAVHWGTKITQIAADNNNCVPDLPICARRKAWETVETMEIPRLTTQPRGGESATTPAIAFFGFREMFAHRILIVSEPAAAGSPYIDDAPLS